MCTQEYFEVVDGLLPASHRSDVLGAFLLVVADMDAAVAAVGTAVCKPESECVWTNRREM